MKAVASRTPVLLRLRKAGMEPRGTRDLFSHAYLTMNETDDWLCQVGKRCLQKSSCDYVQSWHEVAVTFPWRSFRGSAKKCDVLVRVPALCLGTDV